MLRTSSESRTSVAQTANTSENDCWVPEEVEKRHEDVLCQEHFLHDLVKHLMLCLFCVGRLVAVAAARRPIPQQQNTSRIQSFEYRSLLKPHLSERPKQITPRTKNTIIIRRALGAKV